MSKKKILMPDLLAVSILEIPLDDLAAMGKKAMIFDLDNTITEWNNPVIHDRVISWFHHLKEKGITACLVSNNSGPRVMEAANILEIPFVAKATKPRRRGYIQALKLMGTLPGETVMVGDQLFTDIFGGNRMALFTILVAPMSMREFVGTRFVRRIERITMKRLGISHGNNNNNNYSNSESNKYGNR